MTTTTTINVRKTETITSNPRIVRDADATFPVVGNHGDFSRAPRPVPTAIALALRLID